MANLFTAREIVELGIQIEKNGRDFYNAVSEKSRSEKARERFLYLAEQEEHHIDTFKMIMTIAEQSEPQESYPGEYLAYINALAGEHIFTQKDKGSEVAKQVKTDMEAIDLAIGFEKDSIILYGVMKRAVPIDQHKVLDALIHEEQLHLVQLVEIKSSMQ